MTERESLYGKTDHETVFHCPLHLNINRMFAMKYSKTNQSKNSISIVIKKGDTELHFPTRLDARTFLGCDHPMIIKMVEDGEDFNGWTVVNKK